MSALLTLSRGTGSLKRKEQQPSSNVALSSSEMTLDREKMASSTTTLSKSGKPRKPGEDTLRKAPPKSKQQIEEEDAQKIEHEGRDAIDYNALPVTIEITAADLEEGEERAVVTEEALQQPKVQEVIRLLIDWINNELAQERIVVKHIVEDLYDGLVIQKLIEKLARVQMNVPEVSQSEAGQLQKLHDILEYCSTIVQVPRWQTPRWTAKAVHGKDLAAILQLLVALALHFRAPVRFPDHCQLQVLVVQRREGQLQTRYVTEEITGVQEEFGLRGERDAFDTLFDHAPDKLQVVKKSLLSFVNKHLNKINLEVSDLETQFQDGVYLVLMMGLLEGYFVPLYSFHLTANTFEQRVHNVTFSFELMEQAGLPRPRSRAEDIVNGDVKCTLRLLYGLFSKYKHL